MCHEDGAPDPMLVRKKSLMTDCLTEIDHGREDQGGYHDELGLGGWYEAKNEHPGCRRACIHLGVVEDVRKAKQSVQHTYIVGDDGGDD